jgi:nicotinate-nucleotide adenylyltransferase
VGKVRRIGLLGGSFNPAHDGHLHISRQALDHLKLDEVWWLVSPLNPLKLAKDMAPFDERMASAKAVAGDGRITVSDLERELGTRYAVDTLPLLKERFPDARFVWIMGADNLIQVPQWRHWRGVFRTLPIAVFARPSYSFRALSGRAARRFARYRVRESRIGDLVEMRPPAWAFIFGGLHTASATRIRAQRAALTGRRRHGTTG